MVTSNTVVFRVGRDALIQGALRLCLAIDPENTAAVTANQITNGAEALNMLVKAWEAEGLQLWERKYGAVFLQKGQLYYQLGSPGPGGDHACLSTPIGSGFIKTTLVSALAANATSASLVTITNTAPSPIVFPPLYGMPYATAGVPADPVTNGDNIGIQQTDGTIWWTTVNGVPVGNIVTLTAGPPLGANAGAFVYDYTTKLVRPLRILDGFVRQVGGNDVPCLVIPRENFNRFGQKLSSGTSIQLYYDPQENTGQLYVYPTTLDTGQTLFIEYQNPIQDFNASTDDYDLPQEWGLALKFNLALLLAPEYGVPMEQYQIIEKQAGYWFAKLDAWDQEDASLFLQPSNWPYLTDSSSNK